MNWSTYWGSGANQMDSGADSCRGVVGKADQLPSVAKRRLASRMVNSVPHNSREVPFHR